MYVLGQVVCWYVSIDYQTLLGCLLGEHQKRLADSGLEPDSCLLESIFPAPVAPATSLQRRVDVKIKKKCDIRRQTAGGNRIHLPHKIDPQAPSDALIGHRGLRISVADDGLTGSECRLDDLGHMLAAAGPVEEEFGHVVEMF